MAQPFQTFVDTYNGTGHDMDGAYGYQCWDGYAFYMQWLGYSYAHCTATGGAVDIWTLRATNGMMATCEVITSNPQNGDIAVWGTNMGGGYGHVAMYYNGKYMGQNQSGGSSTGAPFSIISISTAPLGWFRPNCYKGGSGGDTYKLQLTLVGGIVINAQWVKQ